MKYSFIIPVYNRPDEVDELLESLTHQSVKDFEVVVVEDGSNVPCEKVVAKYADRLDVHYFSKTNSGPGQTRTTEWNAHKATMCSSSIPTWYYPKAISLQWMPNLHNILARLSAVRTAHTPRSRLCRRPSTTP